MIFKNLETGSLGCIPLGFMSFYVLRLYVFLLGLCLFRLHVPIINVVINVVPFGRSENGRFVTSR